VVEKRAPQKLVSEKSDRNIKSVTHHNFADKLERSCKGYVGSGATKSSLLTSKISFCIEYLISSIIASTVVNILYVNSIIWYYKLILSFWHKLTPPRR